MIVKTNKYQTRLRHGETGTRLYRIWNGMIRRCELFSSGSYKWYGAKGISVCSDWRRSYESFRDWAHENGYKENLTLDRIDGEKDYSPNNCRWITMKDQQNNRCNNHLLTYNGLTLTLSQWAEKIGLKPKTLAKRINEMHWSIEKALTTPLYKQYQR